MSLLPSLAELKSYLKTSINPVGRSELTCWVRGHKHQVLIQVVDGNYTSLLGQESCDQLPLVQCISTIGSKGILDEFPEVFQWLGCLPAVV